MSLSKVKKNVENLSEKLPSIGNLKKIPVVLTDSKGYYLEAQVNKHSHPENKIIWWWQSSQGVEERFNWLRANIQHKISELGSLYITLYIWVGTCDLTKKSGRFIKLAAPDNFSAVNRLCRFYKDIYEYISAFPTITLIFLELPFYSIYFWNLSKSHTDSEPYREEDKILEQQIAEVNKYIRSLNLLLHPQINSVDFGLDLEKSHKTHYQRAIRYCNNYHELYLDGIHPTPKLAKLWVLRLALRLQNDCK